jgi:hypothetical protein
MAKKAEPSRVAAALQYLQQMRDRAADFGGGVVDTLADRARSVGGLAYEALTSDPNIGRMTTAEYAQAADRPTPRLNQAAQDLGTIGKAIVTQPVQTGKALVQGEVERARQAMTSPRAAGEYAGSMVDPMRIAAALRKTAPIVELDVYHGTPHRFPETEANPLGEFDASKIGTGEGAQAYGHGIYLAESPAVGRQYAEFLASRKNDLLDPGNLAASMMHRTPEGTKEAGLREIDAALKGIKNFPNAYPDAAQQKAALEKARELLESGAELPKQGGNFYTADLPDEMIDRMLDWDKSLLEQPPAVRKALRDAKFTQIADEIESSYLESLPPEARALALKMINGPYEEVISHDGRRKGKNLIAAKNWDDLERLAPGIEHNEIFRIRNWHSNKNAPDFYAELSRVSDKEASERLRQAGIPGIRYLDAGSRGKDGTGTRNFVVFPGEEKKVKILKRD